MGTRDEETARRPEPTRVRGSSGSRTTGTKRRRTAGTARHRATGVHSTNGTADGRRREANQKAKAGSRREHTQTEVADAIES